MKRRRLLSSAAIALCGFLAGCSDGTGNTDSNGSNDSATATQTRSPGATSTAARTTGTTTTETTTEESTGTVGSRTFTESGKPRGPQTVTARVPATEAATPPETTETTETATPATTLSTATETTRGSADTPTPIPIPDAPSTQTGMDTSTISFANGGSRVVVSGTVTGKDGCRKAVLESVQPNGANLAITVGTERDAGTDTMCTQALTPVDYRFVVTPDTPPDSVTVVHTGTGGRRTITTAERGG